MYFQIIDPKFNCPSVFFDGKIVKNPSYGLMCRTWSYHPSFAGKTFELAQILANGKNLEECCPEHLKEKWNEVKTLHSSFEKSFKESKLNLKDHCFYDLVPESFVESYFGIKNEITQHVFETIPKQLNYEFLSDLNELIDEIYRKRLNINIRFLDKSLHDIRAINLKKKLNQLEPRIKYNLFGTITGRLTTKKNSFPILTLDKKFRGLLEANNSWFVELDFNGAELRTFLALNGIPQPKNDLHEWHRGLNNQTFSEDIDRNEMKKKFFAWLYSGKNELFGVPEIDKAYDRQSILDKFWDGDFVKTPYDREIATDERKAVNTVIQSTTADTFFRRVIEVNRYLKKHNLKSFIAMMIHDSMIIDMDRYDKHHLSEIIKIFSDTEFGKFLTTVKIGKNLGDMEPYPVKVL